MASGFASDVPGLALRALHLGKAYRIWRRPEDRLKQMVLPRRRYFEEYWALRDLTLEVKRGETVGFIGRNGAGKSTFLQLVCGTLAPTTGSIETHGRVAALLELGSGFNPEFTGRENITLSAMIMGLSKAEVEARFAAIVDFAAIGDFIDLPVKAYSTGMQARLAFAVAAHVDADILIVDETLSVGDIAFGQKCLRFIRSFRQRGTLLFVSHSLDAVTNLCDRAVWLDRGEVRQVGAAQEVCAAYLASVEHEKDGAESFRFGGQRHRARTWKAEDHRAELLKAEGLVSTAKVFSFDPEAAWFGRRGASIVDVKVLDEQGNPALRPKAGDVVAVQITCEAHVALAKPIVGFFLRDHLAQPLFGDNTFLSYRDRPLHVRAGERFVARFHFHLPHLPQGEYVINAAIAEGTQDEHVQHHWAHEAVVLAVESSSAVHGLVGIPMLDITLEKERRMGIGAPENEDVDQDRQWAE